MDAECFSDSNLHLFTPFTGGSHAALTADYAAVTPILVDGSIRARGAFAAGLTVLLTAQTDRKQNGIYTVLGNGTLMQSGQVRSGTLVVTTRSNAVFVAGADGALTNASCAIGPRVVALGDRIDVDHATVITARDDAPDGPGLGEMKLVASMCSAKTWATSSDLSLKTDVRLVGGATQTLDRIRGYTFDWKDGSTALERARSDGEYREYGLIAQEVQAVLPSAVVRTGDTLSVAYASLIPVLIEAVRELGERVTRLEGSPKLKGLKD
jgi:hypothetical protein